MQNYLNIFSEIMANGNDIEIANVVSGMRIGSDFDAILLIGKKYREEMDELNDYFSVGRVLCLCFGDRVVFSVPKKMIYNFVETIDYFSFYFDKEEICTDKVLFVRKRGITSEE